MKAPGLSIREYGKHRGELGLPGHTPWAVQKALKAKRIRKNANGKIDPEEADADWARTTATRPSPVARPPKSKPNPYADARAERERTNAELARLELQQKSGKLVDVEVVRREVFQRARLLRDRILAVPSRVAAQLAAEKDAREVRRILDDELRKVLETIADEA